MDVTDYAGRTTYFSQNLSRFMYVYELMINIIFASFIRNLLKIIIIRIISYFSRQHLYGISCDGKDRKEITDVSKKKRRQRKW